MRTKILRILVVALALGLTGTPAAAFLEALQCEMNPLYDYCLADKIADIAASLPSKKTADLNLVFAFRALHVAHRSEAERKYRPPSPGYFKGKVRSSTMDTVIDALHQAFHKKDFAKAEELVAGIASKGAQRLARQYLAEASLRAGRKKEAIDLLKQVRTGVESIKKSSARLQPLAEIAWLQARAGDLASARETMRAAQDIANSHPIAQLRPLFALDLAATESILDGDALAQKRVESALAALKALPGAPPGFDALIRSVAVKSYGRMGLAKEGVEIGTALLPEVKSLEKERQLPVYRNLFDAGFAF